MKPLECDALWTTQPSKAERFLIWIPFIGWAISHALQGERFKPMVFSIEQQLRARADTSEMWPSDPRRREASSTLRTLIKEELGWPNDHFIPTDPVGIAFWAHQDGLDDVAALQRIGHEFGFHPPTSQWQQLWLHGTLGEFLESLSANRPECQT